MKVWQVCQFTNLIPYKITDASTPKEDGIHIPQVLSGGLFISA